MPNRGRYWYKPWCELRARILLGVGAFAGFCVMAVWLQSSARHTSPYAVFLWGILFHTVLRDVFLVLVIVLASGSLLQERVQGTVGFTLALPVSRRYASAMRALVGYLGVVAMALTPALVLPLASPLVGQHFDVWVALRFALLYSCGGAVVYGVTCLFSHLMEGEYSAFLLALPVIVGYDLLLEVPGLDRFPSLDFIAVMTGVGMPWFDARSGVFCGRLPWGALSGMLMVGAALVWLAVNRMAQRDFA